MGLFSRKSSAPAPSGHAAGNERIRAYEEAVAANYAEGCPSPAAAEAYRNLTRGDHGLLWPGCPEAGE